MTFNRNVQLSNTPFPPKLQIQAVLSGSSAVEDSKVLAAQPDQNQRTQESFQSQTIDGRYKERLGGGQCASNQSQLVMNKHGLGLPRTKALCHAKSALDDFRKKRCLPEAIKQPVVQGLTSDAAVALVMHVVGDFGLCSISAQSEVFYELTRLEKAVEAGVLQTEKFLVCRLSCRDVQLLLQLLNSSREADLCEFEHLQAGHTWCCQQ